MRLLCIHINDYLAITGKIIIDTNYMKNVWNLFISKQIKKKKKSLSEIYNKIYPLIRGIFKVCPDIKCIFQSV